MTSDDDDRVSRKRYVREQNAREEAERLLENKSRELFLANQQLSEHSAKLEKAVFERTAELRLALEKAEAASTARSRFVATMSHEIRTPLGGLLGMIDLLALDETEPAKLELLTYAKTAGKGLSRIVNDVLDFSKMEAGVFVFEVESVDIRALIESVRIMASTNVQNGKRSVIVKIDENVPRLFVGDATRIRQVLSNLVSNAVRYSTEGPIIVRAKSSPHPKGALLRVEVEDFGVGIDQEQTNDLFKDFSQISNSLTAAANGTGLGLAICKRILEGCGGKIGVESLLGVGSTFWFELPVEILSEADVADDEELVLCPPGDTIDLAGRRVLIAEDNIINQKLLLTYTKRMNMIPTLAENGRVALEKFAPGKFDLVLMDIAMPEMDGLEATRRLRDMWAAEDIPPILALTAHLMDAIEDDAALVGIETILSKPIPFDELKTTMETTIQRRHVEPAKAAAEPVKAEQSLPEILGSRMEPNTVKELLENFSSEDLTGLVRDFVNDAKHRSELILSAARNDDLTTVAEEAHSLKGSALVLGFTEISNRAKDIETQSGELGAGYATRSAEKILDELLSIESGLPQ